MLTRRLNPEQMFKKGRLNQVRMEVGDKRRSSKARTPDRQGMRYGQPEGLAPTLPECPSPSVTQAFASRQGDRCSKNVRNKAQNSPPDLRREWTSAVETEGTEGAGQH